MSPIEWRETDPEEMIRDIENSINLYRENKYAFQIGLKDLDFDVNEDILETIGMHLPFRNLSDAEHALCVKGITLASFLEEDNTPHKVLCFDHRPVGYSGFMNCVTHSLAITDHGLFEVGRYQGVSLEKPGKQWQWFLHRRLATGEQVSELAEKDGLSMEQFMEKVYCAYVG